jgi:membrane protease YdiL (CAAX protease family)
VGACVFVFALGHWVQGRGAMVIIVIFAAAFHVLVRLTGDLYTAIVVHVVYDFAAGMLLWRLSAGAR